MTSPEADHAASARVLMSACAGAGAGPPGARPAPRTTAATTSSAGESSLPVAASAAGPAPGALRIVTRRDDAGRRPGGAGLTAAALGAAGVKAGAVADRVAGATAAPRTRPGPAAGAGCVGGWGGERGGADPGGRGRGRVGAVQGVVAEPLGIAAGEGQGRDPAGGVLPSAAPAGDEDDPVRAAAGQAGAVRRRLVVDLTDGLPEGAVPGGRVLEAARLEDLLPGDARAVEADAETDHPPVAVLDDQGHVAGVGRGRARRGRRGQVDRAAAQAEDGAQQGDGEEAAQPARRHRRAAIAHRPPPATSRHGRGPRPRRSEAAAEMSAGARPGACPRRRGGRRRGGRRGVTAGAGAGRGRHRLHLRRGRGGWRRRGGGRRRP